MEVSKFQFENPRLVTMTFTLNSGFSNKTEKPETSQGLPIELKVGTGLRKEQSALVQLTVTAGKEDNNDYPFFLSATMCAEFRWDKTVLEEQVSVLIKLRVHWIYPRKCGIFDTTRSRISFARQHRKALQIQGFSQKNAA